MRLTTTRAAERDLVALWAHIAMDSMGGADRVVARIREEFHQLVRMPRLGRRREDLGDATLRSWPVFDYLVFCRQLEQEVRILRVVHGHQDLRQLQYEDNDWPDTVREQRLPWGLPPIQSAATLLQCAS